MTCIWSLDKLPSLILLLYKPIMHVEQQKSLNVSALNWMKIMIKNVMQRKFQNKISPLIKMLLTISSLFASPAVENHWNHHGSNLKSSDSQSHSSNDHSIVWYELQQLVEAARNIRKSCILFIACAGWIATCLWIHSSVTTYKIGECKISVVVESTALKLE